MRPVSDRFLSAVSSSHRMVSRARVFVPGQNSTTPDPGALLLDLKVISGAATFDTSSDTLGTLDITVSPEHWPVNASDILTPYGNEIFVERGIQYGDGTNEWVSLGFFRIDDVEQQSAPDGEVQVSGSDRMAGVQDQRIPFPLTFTSGTLVTDVIENLIGDIYPWAVYDFDSVAVVGHRIGSDQVTTDDRYGFINDMVTSLGCIWYWDYRGFLVVKPPPDPTVPVTTIGHGKKGVLVSISRSLTRDAVYSGCVASGDQLSEDVPPVSALVVDSDPASPTFWFGPFGKVPQFFSSSFLTTQDQCVGAATTKMITGKGLPYTVNFGMVPNPAIEAYDPAQITYPGRRERHVINQLVVPLDPQTVQTGQTKQLVTGGQFK